MPPKYHKQAAARACTARWPSKRLTIRTKQASEDSAGHNSDPSAVLPDVPSGMIHWMDAYRAGLATQEAQLQVRQFSSTKYKSH